MKKNRPLGIILLHIHAFNCDQTIGIFSNEDDEGGNENVKTATGFFEQTNNSARASRSLVHFLVATALLRRDNSYFRLYGGRNQREIIFFLLVFPLLVRDCVEVWISMFRITSFGDYTTSNTKKFQFF